MNGFGEFVRETREANGLLIRQLASTLEIDTAMLSKIERGARRPKKDLVVRIARALEIDESQLLTLWLASKICDLLGKEQHACEALRVASREMKALKK